MQSLTRLTLLIFLLISFPTLAHAEIKYLNWSENIKLTSTGKKAQVRIRAKVQNLKPRYFHKSFSFIFAPNQKIRITKVYFNGQPAKYEFQGNQLTIIFNESKINDEYFNITFSYQETYDEIYKYLRHEVIYVPKWVSGALSKVSIDYPGSMDVATYDPHLKKINNKFVYEGRVPEDGIKKIIKLTPSKSIWNVIIKNSIISDKNLNNLTITVPVHFQESGQKSYNYRTFSDPREDSGENKRDVDIFKYKNTGTNKIDIKTQATIYTGKDYRLDVIRNPSFYLDVDPKDRILLANMLQKIKSAPNPDHLPLYTRIGHFVHNFINYDISYVGQRLAIPDILSGKQGVCVEYSTLFNTLARMAGIPSIIVSGAAQGEYGKFEAHSWNLVVYNNKWIYVDPTWDLMSGVVSSSHIYFYDGETRAISAKGFSDWGNIKMDTEFEIKEML